MGADELHIQGAEAVSHGGNQAVVVTFDVEHHPAVLEDAGAAKEQLDVRRLLPVGLAHLIHPSLKLGFCCRMPYPEVPQDLYGDDSHDAGR